MSAALSATFLSGMNDLQHPLFSQALGRTPASSAQHNDMAWACHELEIASSEEN